LKVTFHSENEALRQLEMARFTIDVDKRKLIAPLDEFDVRREYDPSERSAAAIDFLVHEHGWSSEI